MIYLIDNGAETETGMPQAYELNTIQDLEDVICRLYHEDDLCMSEILSNLEVRGLSIEAVAELYINMRNYTGDGLALIDEVGEFAL